MNAKPENKIKYGARHHFAEVRPTFTASLRVTPTEPATYTPSPVRPPRASRKRYSLESEAGEIVDGNAALVEILLKALESTSWMQWIRKRMAEEASRATPAPPEVRDERQEPERLNAQADAAGLRHDERARADRLESDTLPAIAPHRRYSAAEQRLAEAREAFSKACEPEAEAMHYTRRGAEPGPREQYQRKAQAHAALCDACDAVTASRQELADRARRHAERTGCSYESAMAELGHEMPTCLPCASFI